MDGIRFVNRESELVHIEEYATAWNTLRIMLVDGPGGIGKSRLLEETYRRRQNYVNILHGQLKVSNVINLDDISFQIPMNLGRRIANELGAARFQSYLERTDQIILLESQGFFTRDSRERAIHEADELFIAAYDIVVEQERIFLLLDTLETAMSLPVGKFLVKLVTRLANTFVLMAGRSIQHTRGIFAQALEESRYPGALVDYVVLQPFAASVSTDYLAQTQVAGFLSSQPQLRDNLVLLTEGRPLLLSLATEWLHHDVPLPELTAYTTEQLRSLPQAQMGVLRRKFEKALVSHIRSLQRDMSDLIMTMAHFDLRFDAEILSAITGEPLDQCRQKMKSLEELFFVKSKPDGNLALHDEMQQLVTDYVWPDIDPFGTRRKELSRRAVEHYRRRLDRLVKSLPELEIAIKETEERKSITQAAHMRRDFLGKKRLEWILTRELLHYTLDADLSEGVKLFESEFDRALAQSQFSSRVGLVQEMLVYVPKLSSVDIDLYEVNIRISRHYADEAEYQKARDLLVAVDTMRLSPSQRVNVLIQLANVEIRLGNFNAAINDFREGVAVSETDNLTLWLIKAKNGLGWVHRLIGERGEAIKYYQEAQILCLDSPESSEDYGWILNNLTFVLSYRDRKTAVDNGLAAIRHWTKIKNEIGLGAAHGALGSVYYQAGDYTEALKEFGEALKIFEPNYQEWMATIYSWRGATYQDIGETGKAEQDLLKSLKIGPAHIEAMTLNRLGRVYMSKRDWVAAERYNVQSYERARVIPDYLYWLGSLARLITLAARAREYDKLDRFIQQLDDCLRAVLSPDGNSLGIAYIGLGRLALGNRQIEAGVDYFKKGVSLITEYGPYAHTGIVRRLGYVQEDFDILLPDVIRQLGSQLMEYCKEKQKSIPAYGVLIPIFHEWANWS